MKKKIIIITSLVSLILVVLYVVVSLTKKSPPKATFLDTIPLISKEGDQESSLTPTIYPPINPPQTNLKQLTTEINTSLSGNEKDKIIDSLPLYIKDFSTGTKINTTISVYTLLSDPAQSVRIEIYGPNYNSQDLTSEDAKSFVSSFQEVKKRLSSTKVNFQNLQIIYGNRQYIQDTASYWAKTLNLLN